MYIYILRYIYKIQVSPQVTHDTTLVRRNYSVIVREYFTNNHLWQCFASECIHFLGQEVYTTINYFTEFMKRRVAEKLKTVNFTASSENRLIYRLILNHFKVR